MSDGDWTEALADRYRAPEVLDQLRNIAAQIFSRYDVPFESTRRGGGWSNVVLMGGGLVLRLSADQGKDDLRREARLVALLPPEVGYPPVIDCGETGGFEWSLLKEIQGVNLGNVWPNLDWNERADALRQLWQKAEAVHRTDATAAASIVRERTWFYPANAQEAEDRLTRLAQKSILTSAQADALRAVLTRYWGALTNAPRVLNHADLTIENSLWHQGKIVSLLDFEFAVIAPVEMDLMNLVRIAYSPPFPHDPTPEADNAGLEKLREVILEVAKPILMTRHASKDLLCGYLVLLESFLLEEWLAHPEGEGPMEGWEPYLVLISLADEQGGYLAELFRKVETGG